MRLAQTKAGNNSSTFKNESYYQNCLQQFTHVIIILEQKKVEQENPKLFILIGLKMLMRIIKSNESLAENKIKNNFCPNISMKMIFMNTE